MTNKELIDYCNGYWHSVGASCMGCPYDKTYCDRYVQKYNNTPFLGDERNPDSYTDEELCVENSHVFSYIYVILPDGKVLQPAGYTLPLKSALLAYIMQMRGNFNTWEYPDTVSGMRQSDMTGNWYFELEDGTVYCAAPKRLKMVEEL